MSFFGIESVVFGEGRRARLTVGNQRYSFDMTIGWDDLRTAEGREKIYLWAVSVASIPESGISLQIVEQLLEFLDQQYPISPQRNTRWWRWCG